MRFGAALTRLVLEAERRARRARDHGRLPARRGEAAARRRRAGRAADRRPRRARWCRSSCPTGSSSCSGRRRCAARTSTRSSPRCGRAAPARAAPTPPRSAQRNALIAAIRAGRAGRGSLPAWDAELARHGIALMRDRAEAVERLRPRFAAHAGGRRPRGRGRARLPAALEGAGRRRARRRAGRARRRRRRARLHRPRPAPRRPRLPPRRPRAARLRVARPAAARPAGAAARRARGAGRRSAARRR